MDRPCHEADNDTPMSDAKQDKDLSLMPPTQFPFPFRPYDIQEQFMSELFNAIERGGLGIFESPTGTGKSLTLLCGSLAWLRENAKREERRLLAEDVSDPEAGAEAEKSSALPSWVVEQATDLARREKQSERLTKLEHLKKERQRLDAIRAAGGRYGRRKADDSYSQEHTAVSPPKKPKTAGDDVSLSDDEVDLGDEAFLPTEFDALQARVDKLLADEDDGAEKPPEVTKILFCSRTHSQLAQIVQEVKNTVFCSDLKLTVLGSRQTSCINDVVRKLGDVERMNDKCLDLQKNKATKSKKKGCPFLNRAAMDALQDHILAAPKDVEELVHFGRIFKACSYYSARSCVPTAELVLMPYNTLLHKRTRETMGISLKGNVVIIDEAHNLLDTVSAIHSHSISARQLARACGQLMQYQARYKKRLKPKNLFFVNQLLFVIKAFIKIIKSMKRSSVLRVNDFLCESNTDNINLFDLLHFCDCSEIAKKLHGFVDAYLDEVQTDEGILGDEGSPNDEEFIPKHVSTLYNVISFLSSLSNASTDGRIALHFSQRVSRRSLQYILLNPSVAFQEVLLEARAVIVAGGTMSPVNDFIQQLRTPETQDISISVFECSHVVDPSNIFAMVVPCGPTQRSLNFSFENRNTTETMDELGRALVNVFATTPKGIVIFFPSYDYEKKVVEHFKSSGCWSRLEAKKQLFREPKSTKDADKVLQDYAKAVNEPTAPQTGAAIFAVVGGKLSEGINFKDDLGRCVVMVGLPYPNKHSPVLQEKLNYLTATRKCHQESITCTKNGETFILEPTARNPAEEYYQNLCMKAVNQSIGRAIRHINDYAAILLFDERYSRQQIKGKLPKWIAGRLTTSSKFGQVCGGLSRFFAGHRKKATSTAE